MIRDAKDYSQRQLFFEFCDKCSTKHSIYTQQDKNPEYYTDIYVVCKCGDVVHFLLPVN